MRHECGGNGETIDRVLCAGVVERQGETFALTPLARELLLPDSVFRSV